MEPEKLKQFIETCKGLKVLYVEDNPEARKQTYALLDNFFAYIDVAVDGNDGLEKYNQFYKLNNQYYDLVITDINMPNMDGLDMCKYIFIINPKQHVLTISAHNDTDKLEKLIDLGVSQYMQKPIESKELTLS